MLSWFVRPVPSQAPHGSGGGDENEVPDTFGGNLTPFVAILEAVSRVRRPPRILYACSSLIYGAPTEEAVTEATMPTLDVCTASRRRLGLKPLNTTDPVKVCMHRLGFSSTTNRHIARKGISRNGLYDRLGKFRRARESAW
jgi:hypothetical protein